MPELVDQLRRIGRDAGLAAIGVTSADPFAEARVTIESRKAHQLHGGMQFTFRNPARSTEPARMLDGARSLLVGAWRYPAATTPPPRDQPSGQVAAYARVDHYAELREALETVAERLRVDGHTALVVADDNSLVDRAAAIRAGIGWQGKNTNILLPGEGSWFVLGAVLTDAELPNDSPVADGCGPCTRCLGGCPTGALIAPGVLDARRCLAWLVQAPGEIPRQFRVAMHDRVYGCDDCQEVCPPNRRAESEPSSGSTTGSGQWVPLLDLLEADDAEVIRLAGRWYIPQRDPRYVRRNAIVALGNIADAADRRVVAVIESYLGGCDDLLAAHAVWTARRLGLDHLAELAAPGPLVELERNAPSP